MLDGSAYTDEITPLNHAREAVHEGAVPANARNESWPYGAQAHEVQIIGFDRQSQRSFVTPLGQNNSAGAPLHHVSAAFG